MCVCVRPVQRLPAHPLVRFCLLPLVPICTFLLGRCRSAVNLSAAADRRCRSGAMAEQKSAHNLGGRPCFKRKHERICTLDLKRKIHTPLIYDAIQTLTPELFQNDIHSAHGVQLASCVRAEKAVEHVFRACIVLEH